MICFNTMLPCTHRFLKWSLYLTFVHQTLYKFIFSATRASQEIIKQFVVERSRIYNRHFNAILETAVRFSQIASFQVSQMNFCIYHLPNARFITGFLTILFKLSSLKCPTKPKWEEGQCCSLVKSSKLY
jgi:ABC-type polysaccharide/polyol phosphate export permease